MAVYYDRCGLYIESKKSYADKIAAVDQIISALEAQALASAGTSNIEEYQLNDGQTIIKQIYRGTSAIMKAINDFEQLKQYYINRYNGRVYRAVDSKNFRNNDGNRF